VWAIAKLTQASIENDAGARNALSETAKSMMNIAQVCVGSRRGGGGSHDV
jgi:hypothetical protein